MTSKEKQKYLYHLFEWKHDERGIYRDFQIGTYTKMKDVKDYLTKDEETKEKWRLGFFTTRPVPIKLNPDTNTNESP